MRILSKLDTTCGNQQTRKQTKNPRFHRPAGRSRVPGGPSVFAGSSAVRCLPSCFQSRSNSSGLCRRKRGRVRQPGAIHSMIYFLIDSCTSLLNICRSSYVCSFKVCTDSFSDVAVASAIARNPSSAVTVFLRFLRNRLAAPLTLRFHYNSTKSLRSTPRGPSRRRLVLTRIILGD